MSHIAYEIYLYRWYYYLVQCFITSQFEGISQSFSQSISQSANLHPIPHRVALISWAWFWFDFSACLSLGFSVIVYIYHKLVNFFFSYYNVIRRTKRSFLLSALGPKFVSGGGSVCNIILSGDLVRWSSWRPQNSSKMCVRLVHHHMCIFIFCIIIIIPIQHSLSIRFITCNTELIFPRYSILVKSVVHQFSQELW